jgi:hypothetical protein
MKDLCGTYIKKKDTGHTIYFDSLSIVTLLTSLHLIVGDIPSSFVRIDLMRENGSIITYSSFMKSIN